MAKVLLVSFLIFAGVSTIPAQNGCPNIVPRGGWSARTPTRAVPLLPIRPAPFIVFHVTNTGLCDNLVTCSAIIRDIQTFHMEVNGWPDISYHFIVGADFRIYEGRGWGRIGENVEGFTNQTINIGFLGGFLTNSPSPRISELFDSLIACGISIGALDPEVAALTKCQVNPRIERCDRTTIYNWLSQHPRFEAEPVPV